MQLCLLQALRYFHMAEDGKASGLFDWKISFSIDDLK